jgi:hypothetical protein
VPAGVGVLFAVLLHLAKQQDHASTLSLAMKLLPDTAPKHPHSSWLCSRPAAAVTVRYTRHTWHHTSTQQPPRDVPPYTCDARAIRGAQRADSLSTHPCWRQRCHSSAAAGTARQLLARVGAMGCESPQSLAVLLHSCQGFHPAQRCAMPQTVRRPQVRNSHCKNPVPGLPHSKLSNGVLLSSAC